MYTQIKGHTSYWSPPKESTIGLKKGLKKGIKMELKMSVNSYCWM